MRSVVQVLPSCSASPNRLDLCPSLSCLFLQVVKGCSNGHFNHGVLFERFECDFRDVCSRVERLIGDGYIRRDIGHPHVLVYVPDPTELMQVRNTRREGEGERERESERVVSFPA